MQYDSDKFDPVLHRGSDDQRGNALFLILIAVVLFAALSYAITQTNRGGSNATTEKASILASEMMSYGSEISTALTRLLIRGCDLSEISFENSNEPGLYVNPNSPANKSCHIFDLAGGGVPWRQGPAGIRYDWNVGQYKFGTSDSGAGNPLSGIGTATQADLYLVLTCCSGLPDNARRAEPLVKACEWINARAGISGLPFGVSSSWYGGQFTGTFNDGIGPLGVSASLEGQTAFCVAGPSDAAQFIYVLQAR